VSLKGGRELRSRLRAIKTVFKPVAREWTQEVVAIARPQVPVRTGRTRQSIRRGRLSQKKATVVGSYVTNFIDAGTKAHDIKAKRGKRLKFETGSRTVFAKKVHKRSDRCSAVQEGSCAAGLEKVDILSDLLTLWRQATR
jgi:hypothetical protein